jgi:hypothetical protein
MPLILGGSGALLVLVLGVCLIAWLFGGGGGAGALAQWVPGDAEGFVSVRVADVWKTEQVKEALAELKKEAGAPDFEAEMDKAVGLKPADIDRVTFVARESESEIYWVVVETVSAYDEAKLRKKIEGAEDLTHQGKKYVRGRIKGEPKEVCVHFAGPRLLVLGTEKGVQRALGLPSTRAPGPMDDGLNLLSTSRHVVNCFTIPGKGKKAGLPPKFAPLAEAKSVTATISVGAKTDVELTGRYADNARAEAAKKAAEEGLDIAKAGLTFLRAQESPDTKPLLDVADKFLKSVTVNQSGSTVFAKGQAEISGSAIMKALKNNLMRLR